MLIRIKAEIFTIGTEEKAVVALGMFKEKNQKSFARLLTKHEAVYIRDMLTELIDK